MAASYSFVSKKDPVEKLELLETTTDSAAEAAVRLKIVRGSLTANNKFYWSFGEKPPFSFNKCYPVDTATSKLANGGDADLVNYMHPVVWGIVEVTSSNIDGVEVGSYFMGMVPMGETISFSKAALSPTDPSSLVVDRPATFKAYNSFSRVKESSAMFPGTEHSDMALACMPGIVTGHGLYFRMLRTNCYGADTVVVTSASSKVALAMTLYMKNDPDKKFENITIVGFTSETNMKFCQDTGLYDSVLSYDKVLPSGSYIMVDISGRGDIYANNNKEPSVDIVKLLVCGNASGTDDQQGTFATFSKYAYFKMVCGMIGVPAWLHSWMPKPMQELYLIWEDMAEMKKEWGDEKLKKHSEERSLMFCEAAKKWISVREAKTEEEICGAFTDILQGSVPPSETIALDVVKAAAHRK